MKKEEFIRKIINLLYKYSDAYYSEVLVLADKIYDLFEKEWKEKNAN